MTRSRPGWLPYESLAKTARVCVVAFGIFAAIVVIASAIGFDLYVLFLLMCMASALLLPGLVFMLAIVAWPAMPMKRRERAAATVFPLVVASVLLTQWPFFLSFSVHRSFMNEMVQQVEAGSTPAMPRRVGLFRIRGIASGPDGNIGFQLTGDGGGGNFLVRRQPDATSRNVWYNTNWEYALGGGWYWVYED